MLEAEGTAGWEALRAEELGTFEDRKEASVGQLATAKPRAQIGYREQRLFEKTLFRS